MEHWREMGENDFLILTCASHEVLIKQKQIRNRMCDIYSKLISNSAEDTIAVHLYLSLALNKLHIALMLFLLTLKQVQPICFMTKRKDTFLKL